MRRLGALGWISAISVTACALDPDPRASYFEAESEGDDAMTSGTAGDGPIVDGSVVTIYDIQQGRVAQGTTVRVENVVVTSPLLASEGAIVVQDPMGGPWSGVYLYLFDEAAQAFSAAPGDVVTFTGEYTEYYDFSEMTIRNAGDIEVVAQGDPLAPLVVPAADVAAQSQTAEQYESVLVRVEGAMVTNADLGHGDWEVAGGTVISNFFLGQQPLYPSPGATYESITGPLLYNFETYKIAPRTAADVVGGVAPPSGPVTIFELQQGMVALNAAVEVRDVVVTTPIADGTFWVQDPAGGMFSGIAVFLADGGMGVQVQPGSVVTLQGTYKEFFEQSQIEIATGQGVQASGNGQVPAPAVVTAAEVGGTDSAEAWEGVLVQVQDVAVTMPPDMFGDFEVDGALLVTDTFFGQGGFPAPTVDDAFTSLTGVLAFSFDEYRLAPRSGGDIVPAGG